jgi:TonB-dependent receptor
MEGRKSRARAIPGLISLGLIGLCLGAGAALAQQGQGPPDNGSQRPAAPGELQEVIVTGYRKSLQEATAAKRESVTFTDSVFAEDIGKFPDLNIAESLNRIPGVQLVRDVNGDGQEIAIRGLGTSFTKVLLNGTPVAVADNGPITGGEQNREVDLDLFPTELFTRLDVNKTQMPSILEGGAAGTVNMRSTRPFDNPGTHFTYQVQEGYANIGRNFSPRGAATASWTNDTFGVLAGLAAVHNKTSTSGYETVGWTNPAISYGMCGTTPPLVNGVRHYAAVAPTCNQTGGNGWSLPGVSDTTGIGVVPAGAGAGLVAGTPIDAAFLLAHNPGLTLEQISDAMIPRLGRPVYVSGKRDRVAALLSFEYRPADTLSFYLDTLYAKAHRAYNREDIDLVGRSGGIIPLNLKVDSNDVVTQGTFANAQYFLEARPYKEYINYYNLNPGMHYQPFSWVGVDFQLNRSVSTYYRDTPTILVNTPLGQGVTVDYVNNGGIPTSSNANINLDDPNAGWTWAGGRVNVSDEHRDTETKGGHMDVQFGNDPISVKVGGAFDQASRKIIGLDNSAAWQQAVCGGGGTFNPTANPQPACTGGPGSAIPQSALASYLRPGPAGFISVDYNRFFADSNYATYTTNAPVAGGSNTGALTGGIFEKTWGAYVELNGHTQIWGRDLRVNAGGRWVTTNQIISGPYLIAGQAQPGPWQNLITDYNNFLPALNLTYNLTSNIVTRFAASKTMTRANPSAMIPNTGFGDQSAQAATQGNPNLAPYLSKNLDLGGEWYTGAEGYVGLALFQKKLTGFTVNGNSVVPFSALGIPYASLSKAQRDSIDGRGGPDAALVTVTQQVNAPGLLTIRGLEANWVQPLGRWFELLDGFGYTINHTHITQHGDGTGAPAQALGVSPNSYNGTVYFEKYGASIRVSYVWNAGQISSPPNQNGIGAAQLFGDSYGQWDLSASYELPWLPSSPQITLNAINFTDSKQRSTFQYPNATNTFYDPGYQILLGIRGKF